MIKVRRALSLLSLGALALGGGLSPIALWMIPANAVVPPDVFKDAAGNVYVHSGTGITSGARVEVDLVGVPLTRRIRAGYCGQLTLSPSTSVPSLGNSVTINNGTPIDLTAITTTTTPPSCTGNAFTPATTTPFKLANGRIVLPGYIAGTVYNVKFNDLPSSANATVNGCNFATIRHTTARPLPASIKINGTSYTVASLDIADPPLCRRDASTGVSTRYVPATW